MLPVIPHLPAEIMNLCALVLVNARMRFIKSTAINVASVGVLYIKLIHINIIHNKLSE